jgi:hypothetical protein
MSPRTLGWLLFGVCTLLVIASAAEMTRRIACFNRDAKLPSFKFGVSTARHFKLFGRDVSLTDVTEEGASYLRLTWGDRSELIRVNTPPVKDLPDLGGGYGEWVKFLEVNDGERYVLVSRLTPEGFDPGSWGQVRRSDWTFDFHQFQPDGTITHETFRWPRSRHSEASLRNAAEGDGKTPPDPGALALLAIPPLEERSWQYQAALHVIPKLNVPRHRFDNDAFDPRVMGWTLPVGMLAGLGAVAGFFIAIAPRRRAGSAAQARGSR